MKVPDRQYRATILLHLIMVIALVLVCSAYIIIARNQHLSDNLYKIFICSGFNAVWWKWVA